MRKPNKRIRREAKQFLRQMELPLYDADFAIAARQYLNRYHAS